MAGPPWVDPPRAWAVDGRVIEIRTPSTPELVRALLAPDGGAGLAVILATCTTRDSAWLIQRIAVPGSAITLAWCDEVADALVMALTGAQRWTVQRLWERSIGAWSMIDGELLAAGVDATVLSPARASNAVLGVWRRMYSRAPEAWEKWLAELSRPPARAVRRKVEQATPEANLADFIQFQAAAAAVGVSASAPQGSRIVMPDRLH